MCEKIFESGIQTWTLQVGVWVCNDGWARLSSQTTLTGILIVKPSIIKCEIPDPVLPPKLQFHFKSYQYHNFHIQYESWHGISSIPGIWFHQFHRVNVSDSGSAVLMICQSVPLTPRSSIGSCTWHWNAQQSHLEDIDQNVTQLQMQKPETLTLTMLAASC